MTEPTIEQIESEILMARVMPCETEKYISERHAKEMEAIAQKTHKETAVRNAYRAGYFKGHKVGRSVSPIQMAIVAMLISLHVIGGLLLVP